MASSPAGFGRPRPKTVSEVAFGDDLFDAISARDWSRALDLVKRGAPVDHVCTRPGLGVGSTTLHVAIERGAPLSVVDALLQLGADPNATNFDGRNPLHLGLATRSITKASARALVAAGVDVNAVTHNGHTPLTLALKNHAPVAVVDVLLRAGASTRLVQTKDPTWEGFTPLLVALRSSASLEVVRLLVEDGGVDLDARLADGSRAIDIAKAYCDESVALLFETPPALPKAMFGSMIRSFRESLAVVAPSRFASGTSPASTALPPGDGSEEE